VVVNCDRSEHEYRAHIARMHPQWLNVPFTATKTMEHLEDVAHAATIPKVSVFKPTASLEVPVLKDIKPIILKNQNMDVAVKELMDKLLNL
jgi:hypothetical protein